MHDIQPPGLERNSEQKALKKYYCIVMVTLLEIFQKKRMQEGGIFQQTLLEDGGRGSGTFWNIP